MNAQMQINASQMQNQIELCMVLKRRGCYEEVMSQKRGLINYTSLKGLSLYKKLLETEVTDVPECAEKFNHHVKMTEITLKFKDLCKFIPKQWQDECKARSINCLTPESYPYTKKQLATCLKNFTNKFPTQAETNDQKEPV